jgi:DNA-binding winged helix-turn-helix (wHTH) protein
MHVRFIDMQIRFADVEMDTLGYLLRRAGERVPLRPKVFDLLIHLARNRERVVPRDELIELLWGKTVVGAGSLSGLVNELRTALGERGGIDSSIRTVHARGYQFVAEVREESREGGLAIFDELGGEGVPDPPPSARLLDQLGERLSVFMRDEVRPIVENEGFEPLSEAIVEALLLHLSILEGRSGPRGGELADGLSGNSLRRPERSMRMTRSMTSRDRREMG